MRSLSVHALVLLSTLTALPHSMPAAQRASEWQAGAAKVDITPTEPLPMAGYASRGNRPFTGVEQPLYARALVVRHGDGPPAALVSLELVGISKQFAHRVLNQIEQRLGIPPQRVMIVCTHTHTGPAVYDRFKYLLGLTEDQAAAIDRYLDVLEHRIVAAVTQAANKLQPARLQYGQSVARFAMNRRARRNGRIVLGVNRQGPVDHSVPVLWVRRRDGAPLAVVYGYACHCTTLGGDYFRLCGDFAGYASEQLEGRFPGAVALFATGCGGDANPYPRLKLSMAKEHGNALARAVERTLGEKLRAVRGPLVCLRREISLRFAPGPSLEEYQQRAKGDPSNRRVRHARWILEVARRHGGKLPEQYPYTLQGWRFDDDLTVVALAGEVVVEYALQTKAKHGRPEHPVWVIAYANDVFAYIPTEKMFDEGGYEPVGSMLSWGWHSTWARDVERRVLRAIDALIQDLDK